jgi:RNA polymerase sigma factor (sigma-70 family)
MAETHLPPESESAAGLPMDWAGVLARHDRFLRTAVFARLGERGLVDEVMQEVALAAVAQRAPLKDATRVGAWLYRLAVRQVLLHRRRCGRQRRLLGSLASGQRREPVLQEPLDWLLHKERASLIREALARLPRRDAEILLLKYSEDRSYRELATQMGLSESAVEARLHRARKRLREALSQTPDQETPE